MWHDWAWGYPYFTPHRWSPFGYDRWGYNSYSYSYYGWNNWSRYGYNSWYQGPWNNRGYNVVWNYSRRGSNGTTTRSRNYRATTNSNTSVNTNRRTNYNKRVIRNSNDKTINNNPRGYGRPESNNNGRRSRVRENIPTQPVKARQPSTVQPDKYVEDKDHPYYNKLGPAANQTSKDAMAAAEEKTSFVWDTTASGAGFQKNLDKLLALGYEVYMVMVYAHPMISYVSNFYG